ncbi:hypothetical protein [Hydrogenophilus thermoluteolus]|uniref:Uncharacterized protein n=1 Tax=Hydrogenophilus thermoluteolus TaxID=297 RepID=A0A2Z6DXK8_HYDTE|nr:hypothetical protein [Hydrogenophilus thermoluteolus]MBW7656221.1 hypothetical protein [Hydrogenophilus thermoluteolus]BBD77226.1 hypothetical protein HPTL_0959 [Hydrogenophilus thermoluteolus]
MRRDWDKVRLILEALDEQIKDEAKRRGVALTLDAIAQIARSLIAGGG